MAGDLLADEQKHQAAAGAYLRAARAHRAFSRRMGRGDMRNVGDYARITYDGVGRMTKKEVPLAVGSPITTFTSAIVTEWAFDKNNRLTSFKDDAANTSTWTYDAKDRVSTMVYPNTSQDVLYTYDANDNVTELTDPAGNVIEDTFDVLDRNTARDVTLVTGFNDTTTESRTFDALNRLTENEDDDYRVTYTYGVRGLGSTVYEEAQEYSTGTAYTKTVTTKYDAAGNRTSQVYPSGLALTYAYNDINALSSVTDGTNTIASFSYVGFRPKVTTFGSGATQTNTYGGFRADVTTIHHETSAPATLLRMDYGYNKVHDRTYERFGASGSAGDAFEYDKARRLTKAWMGSSTPASPSGNTYVQTIVYNMDDDGNRSSVVVTPYGVSPTTTSYSANNLNQYTAVGGTSQSYDANGNLTNNGTLTFKYNYKNLITEVRQSSGGTLVAEYLYDANGRRVVKNVNGGIFERYIYADVETISVLDGSQAWKQDFVFDVTGIDRILMLEQADVLDQDGDSNTTEITRSYYHRNALGSVMEISTANQTEAASYRYTPYGAQTITRGGSVQSSDPLGQHLAFTCRVSDSESGLLYFRGRYQDPSAGRFVERDSHGFEQGANLFQYCADSPGNRVDPTGALWELVETILDRLHKSADGLAWKLKDEMQFVFAHSLRGSCSCKCWIQIHPVDPLSLEPVASVGDPIYELQTTRSCPCLKSRGAVDGCDPFCQALVRELNEDAERLSLAPYPEIPYVGPIGIPVIANHFYSVQSSQCTGRQ